MMRSTLHVLSIMIASFVFVATCIVATFVFDVIADYRINYPDRTDKAAIATIVGMVMVGASLLSSAHVATHAYRRLTEKKWSR